MTKQKRKDAKASFLFYFYRFDLRQRALFQPLAPGKADEEQQAPDAQFAAHGTPNAHQAQPGSQQERQRQPDAPHTDYVQHKTGGAVARTLHGTAGHDGSAEHGLGPGFDAQNLSTQSDDSRIGALGICGGGGYTLKATQTDKRVKAVATLSMFNFGIVRRNGFLNSGRDTIQKRLLESSQQRAAEAKGAAIKRTAGMETQDIPEEELKKMPTLYSEGYIYYGKTHRHPNSTFQYTVRSNLDLFTFDEADNMDLINQPLLMIAGDKADTLYMTQDAFKKATGTNNKELYLVKGATHIQTYWVPKYVNEIEGKLASFYKGNL